MIKIKKANVLTRTYKELPIGAGGAWYRYAFGGGGGVIVSTGTWRSFRPVIDPKKCTKCGICEKFCPDMAIIKIKKVFNIDYKYCKGCGICSNECPVKAIEMVSEKEGL